jgi:uncharacterized membrane protein YraQ (UPF0718 family)
VHVLLMTVKNTWHILVDVAPWLLVGLFLAGILKLWLPVQLLQRWLGGRGFYPVLRAAVIGTPLPLCSCSVLPTAMQLRRMGASKGATVSFLVATPENGADSILLSYVLLGPAMTIIRPAAAILSAVATGTLTELLVRHAEPVGNDGETDHATRCAGNGCCGTGAGTVDSAESTARSRWRRLSGAVMELLDDVIGWLLIGILLAAAFETLVPPDAIARWGSGLLPMLLVLFVSIPVYICATASTPVAASLLGAGISPGTVLVFLLAGPATNLASAGLLRRELGLRATVSYLIGISVTSVGCGLLVDQLLAGVKMGVASQADGPAELFPYGVSIAAALLLAALAVKPLRRRIAQWVQR